MRYVLAFLGLLVAGAAVAQPIQPPGCHAGTACSVKGITNTGPANSNGGSTGTIVINPSAYSYPSGNERARYWSSVLSVTGTNSHTEESNFFNHELTPLPIVSGSINGTVGSITATVAAGAVQSPLTIAAAGTGQPDGTYNLVFAGGSGSGATATATISGGIITATSLTAPGTGYTTAPAVQIAIALVGGENNTVHPYGQIDSGINFTSLFDPLESSFGNHGVMSGTYLSFNGLYTNFSDGITTGPAMGVHLGVINNNSAVGSLTEYDGFYLQPFSGTGSAPTSYYAIKIADSAASITTVGGVNIGTLGANTVGGTLSIQGPDALGTTFPFSVRSSTNPLFSIAGNGNVVMQALSTTYAGPICMLSGGQFFAGRCQVAQLNQKTSTTLSAVQYGQTLNNGGAAAETDLTLPAASAGANYCFVVATAQIYKIIANGTDKIAIGASNSAAGGNIQASTTFSTACILSYGSGQWVSTGHEGTWTVN